MPTEWAVQNLSQKFDHSMAHFYDSGVMTHTGQYKELTVLCSYLR